MRFESLEYLLGYRQFWELRRRAAAELGDRFDIRTFHTAVVGDGGMPLDVLEDHVDAFIARLKAVPP